MNSHDPVEDFKQHNACSEEIDYFLYNFKPDPKNEETLQQWEEGIVEIIKKYGITALLEPLEDAIEIIHKGSTISSSFKEGKKYFQKQKASIMKIRKRMATELITEEPIEPPFEVEPFRIEYTPSGQENKIFYYGKLIKWDYKRTGGRGAGTWNNYLIGYIRAQYFTLSGARAKDIADSKSIDGIKSLNSRMNTTLATHCAKYNLPKVRIAKKRNVDAYRILILDKSA